MISKDREYSLRIEIAMALEEGATEDDIKAAVEAEIEQSKPEPEPGR